VPAGVISRRASIGDQPSAFPDSRHARAAVAHLRDYKDVLHAFQMDGQMPGSESGDEFTDISNANEVGVGGEGFLGGSWSQALTSHAHKISTNDVTKAAADARQPRPSTKVARRTSAPSFHNSLALRRTNIPGGSKGVGTEGVNGDTSAVPTRELLASKDTPAGVRSALLKGHQILKCRVRATSALIGQTAAAVGFREKYMAAIIAVQRGGEDQRVAHQGRLAAVLFKAGDILVLHCLDTCPLLQFREPALNPTPTVVRSSVDRRAGSTDKLERGGSGSSSGGGGGSGGSRDRDGAAAVDTEGDVRPCAAAAQLAAPVPSRPGAHGLAAALLSNQGRFNCRGPNVHIGSASITSTQPEPSDGGDIGPDPIPATRHVSLHGVSFKSRPSGSISVGSNFTVMPKPVVAANSSTAVTLTPPTPTTTPPTMSSPSKTWSGSGSNLVSLVTMKSAVNRVSSMLKLGSLLALEGGGGGGVSGSGEGADKSSEHLAGTNGASPTRTPSVTPDPDLEVLSRWGLVNNAHMYMISSGKDDQNMCGPRYPDSSPKELCTSTHVAVAHWFKPLERYDMTLPHAFTNLVVE